MDVTKFYGRKKINKCVRIKEIDYTDSEGSELASDSDTEKRIFSISSAKNKIIPETDSESDDEAVHNGTHHENREEATRWFKYDRDCFVCKQTALAAAARP